MLRRYRPKHFIKTVADADAPEFLSEEPSLRQLYGLTFVAEKAVGEENAGNVTIQLDGEDAKILEPGDEWTWPMPQFEAGFFDAKAFKVKVENDGDGVRVFTNLLT